MEANTTTEASAVEKMVVRLPAELKDKLAAQARDQGRTRTAHVVLLRAKSCKMPNVRPLVRGGRRPETVHAVVADESRRSTCGPATSSG